MDDDSTKRPVNPDSSTRESQYNVTLELAKAKGIRESSYVTRILRLNLLAPDIVETALNGQSQHTVQSLSEPLPASWQEQRRRLAARAITLEQRQ